MILVNDLKMLCQTYRMQIPCLFQGISQFEAPSAARCAPYWSSETADSTMKMRGMLAYICKITVAVLPRNSREGMITTRL